MIVNNNKTQTTGNTNYTTGLKMQISSAEADLLFTQNELVDTLRPALKITDFTFVIAELLIKNTEYVKRVGMTEAAKEAREKLLYLLEVGELFNTISNDNQKLKLYNRALLGNNQLLKADLAEIKRQEKLSI